MNKTATFELFLFIAGETGISLSELSQLTDLSKQACLQQIEKLKQKYEEDETSALTIIETASKYRMTSKEKFSKILKDYAKNPTHQSLSKSGLEVLSIIAYKQPITRVAIDQLRGMNSSGVLATLRAFDLIEQVGTLEVVGRPSLYGTTEFFLDYMGVNELSELPQVDESQYTTTQEQDLFNTDKVDIFEENENHEN
ncbi:MAG: SMC-Scp complex subunit ScpB [Streptococcaceae bacterium]|nr:SMC-Scp complex subunit ScpB [Streptococcaceae bacterium]